MLRRNTVLLALGLAAAIGIAVLAASLLAPTTEPRSAVTGSASAGKDRSIRPTLGTGAADRASPLEQLAERRRAATRAFPSHDAPTARRPGRASRGEKRGSASLLYESEPDAIYDTETPVEIPIEGDFPIRGTISFWVDASWGVGSQDDASFVSVADGRMRIVKNVSFIRFEALDAAGHADGVGFPIGDWVPGEWHFLTATWDDGVLGLYVDGVLVSQKYVGAIDVPTDSTVVIGSRFPPGTPVALGALSRLSLRARKLSPAAVIRDYDRTRPEFGG
jgi:Concanavalin A-like lectin/glucanases superfamily